MKPYPVELKILKKWPLIRRLRAFLMLVLTLAIALPIHPQLVLADVAPPQPPEGSNISPGADTTNVRMMAETVHIDVASSSDYREGQAGVRADFEMRNLGQSEEKMSVTFPLCMDFPSMQTESGFYKYPALANFNVWVNGLKTDFTTTDEELTKTLYTNADNPTVSKIVVACWANFPVVFPVGRDVYITVTYKQEGYAGDDHGFFDNYVQFPYILFTGADWKDTIGSADILERLPMPVNDLTLPGYPPEGAVIQGNTIHWHMDNFDPDTGIGMISVDVLQPKYWFDLQTQLQNVKAHPNDGESWGLLGEAYKHIIQKEHGFRTDQEQMYQQAIDAYQKAVTLKPNDADWHYGFADLLCWNFILNKPDSFDRNAADLQNHLQDCADQINQTLAINPNHAGVNEIIQDLTIPPDWLIFENGHMSVANNIEYDMLFPPTDISTFVDLNAFTPTPTWSARKPSVTTVPTRGVTLAPLPARTPSPSAPGRNSNWIWWGAGIGMAILLAGLAWMMRVVRRR
ncbi:MAG: hypothetical protein P4L50_06165 [Anaerolineaceae bacterium]|nr:hypothetical protein [Anaerolineaceae bacterium]